MIEYLENRNRTAAFKWALRVGVHSGPAVAGVVGKRKYAFDIWGDTVNVASRMESAGEVGRVNLSAYTYDLIREEFDCEYRGKLDAKGKGQIDMYFVTGKR
jgi:class 3 adenylate cyclase